MKSLHDFFLRTSPMYNRWHSHPASEPTHWGIFLIVALVLTSNIVFTINSYAQTVDDTSSAPTDEVSVPDISTTPPTPAVDDSVSTSTQTDIATSTADVATSTPSVTPDTSSSTPSSGGAPAPIEQAVPTTTAPESQSTEQLTNTEPTATSTEPTATSTGPLTITDFSIKHASLNSLVVPVISFTTSDDTAVQGYLLTTSATTPLANDTGWMSTKPSSYTFAKGGTQTLYAWIKNVNGDIPQSKSALVTIMILSR